MDYNSLTDNTGRGLPRIILYIFLAYTMFIQFKFVEVPGMVTLLGALLLGSVFLYTICSHIDINTYLTREIKGLFVFYLITLVTGVLVSPSISLHLSTWMNSFLYFFIIVSIVYIANNIKNLKICMTFVGILILLIACVFLINPVLYRDTSIAENIRYSISSKLNVNTLGTYFAFGIWIILCAMTFIKKIRPVGIVCILLMLVAIAKTGSRKSIIGAVILLALWYILIFMLDYSKNVILKILITIGLIIGIYFLITQVYSDSMLALRMNQLVETLTSDESSSYSRIVMYERAYQLFQTNPLFGVGFNGYSYYFGGYSHAAYAEVLACTGLVGTVLYFGVYVTSIVRIIKMIKVCRNNPLLDQEQKMLKLALILWLEMSFMAISIIHIYVITSFIYMGFLLAMIRIAYNAILEAYPEYEKYCTGTRISLGGE